MAVQDLGGFPIIVEFKLIEPLFEGSLNGQIILQSARRTQSRSGQALELCTSTASGVVTRGQATALVSLHAGPAAGRDDVGALDALCSIVSRPSDSARISVLSYTVHGCAHSAAATSSSFTPQGATVRVSALLHVHPFDEDETLAFHGPAGLSSLLSGGCPGPGGHGQGVVAKAIEAAVWAQQQLKEQEEECTGRVGEIAGDSIPGTVHRSVIESAVPCPVSPLAWDSRVRDLDLKAVHKDGGMMHMKNYQKNAVNWMMNRELKSCTSSERYRLGIGRETMERDEAWMEDCSNDDLRFSNHSKENDEEDEERDVDAGEGDLPPHVWTVPAPFLVRHAEAVRARHPRGLEPSAVTIEQGSVYTRASQHPLWERVRLYEVALIDSHVTVPIPVCRRRRHDVEMEVYDDEINDEAEILSEDKDGIDLVAQGMGLKPTCCAHFWCPYTGALVRERCGRCLKDLQRNLSTGRGPSLCSSTVPSGSASLSQSAGIYESRSADFTELTYDGVTRGGLLCDDVGIGKTLECIGLIVAHSHSTAPVSRLEGSRYAVPRGAASSPSASRPKSSSSSSTLPLVSPTLTVQSETGTEALQRTLNSFSHQIPHLEAGLVVVARASMGLAPGSPLPGSDASASSVVFPVDDRLLTFASRATLVVVPSAIAAQWVNEVNLWAPELSIFVYDGVKPLLEGYNRCVQAGRGTRDPGRTSKVALMELRRVRALSLAQMLCADIIVTTYDTLTSDVHHQGDVRTLRHDKLYQSIRSPLLSIVWYRIILDEGQMIDGVSSSARAASGTAAARTKMALDLKGASTFRWYVSGTPLSHVTDAQMTMRFLRHAPFANQSWWANVLLPALQCINGPNMPGQEDHDAQEVGVIEASASATTSENNNVYAVLDASVRPAKRAKRQASACGLLERRLGSGYALLRALLHPIMWRNNPKLLKANGELCLPSVQQFVIITKQGPVERQAYVDFMTPAYAKLAALKSRAAGILAEAVASDGAHGSDGGSSPTSDSAATAIVAMDEDTNQLGVSFSQVAEVPLPLSVCFSEIQVGEGIVMSHSAVAIGQELIARRPVRAAAKRKALGMLTRDIETVQQTSSSRASAAPAVIDGLSVSSVLSPLKPSTPRGPPRVETPEQQKIKAQVALSVTTEAVLRGARLLCCHIELGGRASAELGLSKLNRREKKEKTGVLSAGKAFSSMTELMEALVLTGDGEEDEVKRKLYRYYVLLGSATERQSELVDTVSRVSDIVHTEDKAQVRALQQKAIMYYRTGRALSAAHLISCATYGQEVASMHRWKSLDMAALSGIVRLSEALGDKKAVAATYAEIKDIFLSLMEGTLLVQLGFSLTQCRNNLAKLSRPMDTLFKNPRTIGDDVLLTLFEMGERTRGIIFPFRGRQHAVYQSIRPDELPLSKRPGITSDQPPTLQKVLEAERKAGEDAVVLKAAWDRVNCVRPDRSVRNDEFLLDVLDPWSESYLNAENYNESYSPGDPRNYGQLRVDAEYCIRAELNALETSAGVAHAGVGKGDGVPGSPSLLNLAIYSSAAAGNGIGSSIGQSSLVAGAGASSSSTFMHVPVLTELLRIRAEDMRSGPTDPDFLYRVRELLNKLQSTVTALDWYIELQRYSAEEDMREGLLHAVSNATRYALHAAVMAGVRSRAVFPDVVESPGPGTESEPSGPFGAKPVKFSPRVPVELTKSKKAQKGLYPPVELGRRMTSSERSPDWFSLQANHPPVPNHRGVLDSLSMNSLRYSRNESAKHVLRNAEALHDTSVVPWQYLGPGAVPPLPSLSGYLVATSPWTRDGLQELRNDLNQQARMLDWIIEFSRMAEELRLRESEAMELLSSLAHSHDRMNLPRRDSWVASSASASSSVSFSVPIGTSSHAGERIDEASDVHDDDTLTDVELAGLTANLEAEWKCLKAQLNIVSSQQRFKRSKLELIKSMELARVSSSSTFDSDGIVVLGERAGASSSDGDSNGPMECAMCNRGPHGEDYSQTGKVSIPPDWQSDGNGKPVLMPCGHLTHVLCNARWTATSGGKTKCPNCKAEFKPSEAWVVEPNVIGGVVEEIGLDVYTARLVNVYEGMEDSMERSAEASAGAGAFSPYPSALEENGCEEVRIASSSPAPAAARQQARDRSHTGRALSAGLGPQTMAPVALPSAFDMYGTKACVCIHRLLRTPANEKAVVVCSFVDMLKLVQRALNDLNEHVLKYPGFIAGSSPCSSGGFSDTPARFRAVVVQGNHQEKSRAVRAFNNDAHVRVLLLHAEADYSGLTLTTANHLFVLDPHASSSTAVMAQLIGRINRQGQRRPCFVYHLAHDNTCEADLLNRTLLAGRLQGGTP